MNCFLARAVLRDGERAGAGPQLVAEHVERLDRQILEFVGGDVDCVAESLERLSVVEAARVNAAATSAARRMLVRVEDVAFVAELRRGDARASGRAGRRR